ncbi:hypothetical protein CL629_03405 [bacterium]|nr:hypothetical protein [bacterium]|tara:strand:+ start:6580 stop:6954 length:375 start_codon:yes stop_codon:yes gene_type:complete
MGIFSFLKADNDVEVTELREKVDALKRQRRTLRENVEDLKIEKKVSEEDIKHMVRMKEEKLALEYDKKEIDWFKAKEKEIAAIKDQYRDKIEKNLEKESARTQEMYNEILKRLPNVNVKLQGTT